MGEQLFVEAEILKEAAKINGMIVVFNWSEGGWFLAIQRRWVHKEVVEPGQLSGNIRESSRYLF